MPIYEYKRPDGSTFEIVQSFSDAPLTQDPDTGVPVRRVLHAPAVHFKGKGFYNTDYGTRNRQRETAAAAAAEGSKASDGGSSEGTGSKDSKDSKDSSGSSETKAKPESGAQAKDSKQPAAKPKPVAAKS